MPLTLRLPPCSQRLAHFRCYFALFKQSDAPILGIAPDLLHSLTRLFVDLPDLLDHLPSLLLELSNNFGRNSSFLFVPASSFSRLSVALLLLTVSFRAVSNLFSKIPLILSHLTIVFGLIALFF